MTISNTIDLPTESQVIFEITSQIDENGLFYIRDENQNLVHASSAFCKLVNIPTKSPLLLSQYPKIKKLLSYELNTLNSKNTNSLFFAYTLMPGVYFLFFVEIRMITLNENKFTITQFKKFSDFFKHEKILSKLNILDELAVDDGFPINNYLNINPLSLIINNQNKNEKIISWYVVWFFLTGRSIRRIADLNNLNKKKVENSLSKFYTNSGVLNQNNLRAIARKYGWCNYLNKEAINLINSECFLDKKIIF